MTSRWLGRPVSTSLAEAMGPGPLTGIWLIGALHVISAFRHACAAPCRGGQSSYHHLVARGQRQWGVGHVTARNDRSPLVGRCGTVYVRPITRTEERSDLAQDAADGGRAIGRPVNQAGELWTRCTGSLREQVSETTWQLWLSGIEPVDFANGVFVLSVPNGLIRERVETRYLPDDRGHLGQRGRLTGAGPARGTRDPTEPEPEEFLGPAPNQPTWPAGPRATQTGRGNESPRSRSTRSSSSTPSSSPRRTASPTPRPRPWQRPRVAPTTRCSSTGTPGWARPICSTPSGTTSRRTSPAATSSTSPPRRS